MAKQKYSAEQVIDAIQATSGLLTMAARRLNCSHQTIYNYAQNYPTVQAAIDAEREKVTDIAELALYKQIKDGAAWAVCFYLKTQGKKRGYSEQVSVRHGGDPDNPTPIRHEVKTFGDLVDLARDDAGGGAPGPRQGG